MLKLMKSLSAALAVTLLAGCTAATTDASSSAATEREAALFTKDVKICFQNNTSQTLQFDYSVWRRAKKSALPSEEACVIGSEDVGTDVYGTMKAEGDSSTSYLISATNAAFGYPYVLVGCVGGSVDFASRYASDNGQFQLTLVREPDNSHYQQVRFRVTVSDSPEPRIPRATMCDSSGYTWG